LAIHIQIQTAIAHGDRCKVGKKRAEENRMKKFADGTGESRPALTLSSDFRSLLLRTWHRP
jgi:hypothetical protein